jgi:hypothetical protein
VAVFRTLAKQVFNAGKLPPGMSALTGPVKFVLASNP